MKLGKTRLSLICVHSFNLKRNLGSSSPSNDENNSVKFPLRTSERTTPNGNRLFWSKWNRKKWNRTEKLKPQHYTQCHILSSC